MNVRAIYGCRQVGAGHEHLKKLCCYLNMPEPVLSNNYHFRSLKKGIYILLSIVNILLGIHVFL